MDSTVHGILQARILEWVAFPFSRGSSQPTYNLKFSFCHTEAWSVSLSVVSFCNTTYYGLPGKSTGVGWSSWPRDRVQASCIAGGFFTTRATREAHSHTVTLITLQVLIGHAWLWRPQWRGQVQSVPIITESCIGPTCAGRKRLALLSHHLHVMSSPGS